MADEPKLEQNPKTETTPEVVEQKTPETKTELDSLRTEIESDQAAKEAAQGLLTTTAENPQNLDPKRNIIRTIDYNEPADWFTPETKSQNYPADYFFEKEYSGSIPKRYEDVIANEDLIKMRNEGSYIEKMSYTNSVEYYKAIMGGIPPSSEWIVSNGEFFGNKVRTNIVMAIALKELEFKLKNISKNTFRPNFQTLTSYNSGKEKHHGLGMAIDFDPKENWLGKPAETKWNIPVSMSLEAQKMGFDWGMYYFEGRPNRDTDAMHFAYRGRIPTLMKSLKSPEAIAMARNFIIPGQNKSLYDFDDSAFVNLTEGGGSRGKIDTKQLEEENKIVSELADKYDLELKNLKEKPEQLRSILSEADILDIRSNSEILFKKLYPESKASETEIIRSETTRRISAYTDGPATEFGWYTLNYKKVNEAHEMQVGLGEILLDPNIKEIEIIKNGNKIKGTRGNINGRTCFIDSNGNYLSTFTGNKFRIITNEILSDEKTKEEIANENSQRTNYKQSLTNTQQTSSELTPGQLPASDPKLLYLPNYDLSNPEIIDLKKIPSSFGKMKPNTYISKHLPIAKYISEKFNIPISVCLAQSALESGWGGSNRAINSNGYFGIKGGRGMVFKTYSSVFDSFYHYGEVLQNSRYQNKMKEKQIKSKKEFEKYSQAIAEGGYAANSPNYSNKLISIIKTNDLSRFD